MEQDEFVTTVVRKLDSLAFDYFIGGSICSMYYGRARVTQDVDVVVRLPLGLMRDFIALFPEPDYYISDIAIRAALATGGQFNVLHSPSLMKVDFFTPLRDDAFASEQFVRKRRGDIGDGTQAFFASPEDLLIKKLEYYREGGSQKHVDDLAAMLQVQGSDLDYAHIDEWVKRLGLQNEWEFVRTRRPG